jgi:2'-5' RNA ligase
MSDTAMIAFLPANGSWAKQDFPHLTLVYAGEIADRDQNELNAMGKDGISAARAVGGSFSLNVTGVETLGDPGEEVDVLTVYPTPQLLVARRIVESWNKSEFTEFLPHVTVGPAGSAYAQRVVDSTDEYSYSNRRRDLLPSTIHFDRLAVCWGDDRLLFNLNTYDY